MTREELTGKKMKLKPSIAYSMNDIIEFTVNSTSYTGMIHGSAIDLCGQHMYHVQQLRADGDGEHFENIPHRSVIGLSPRDEFKNVINDLAML